LLPISAISKIPGEAMTNRSHPHAHALLRRTGLATDKTLAGKRIPRKGKAPNSERGRLGQRDFLAVSVLALAIAGTLPRPASADVIVVNSEADLRTAIATADASSDASSTIVLGSSFQVGNNLLPVVSKPITIDTQGFTLSGLAGGAVQWSGGTATTTLAGTFAGGDATGPGVAAGIGQEFGGGSFINNGTISGGNALDGGTAEEGAQLKHVTTLTNNGTIQGGNSNGPVTAGAGVVMGGPGTTVTLINNGTIRGGAGLTAGTLGGIGVVTSAGAQPIVNTGTIMGGNGAIAIQADSGSLNLTNSGTIEAGSGQAVAIRIAATTATLTLQLQAGSVIVGNVVANALTSSNALILGGSANDVFDVSSIGSTAQYQNFNLFEKTGTSTWALTGAGTAATPWSIQQGTLQIGNGGTSGSIIGDVADNGTLAFDRSDTFSFDSVISGTGSVNQAGTGTTILSAANSYTGGTNVLAGTLAVGDAAHTGATVGAGLTSVAAGATLGGYGTVTGSVDNSGTVASANALLRSHRETPAPS
jgi:autotransporter-associated beta strand protein